MTVLCFDPIKNVFDLVIHVSFVVSNSIFDTIVKKYPLFLMQYGTCGIRFTKKVIRLPYKNALKKNLISL